ncbi:MAG: CPBP family intramembrane metalloprotease [Deltaproteobacteria bacterium]|nr:CPBP family intramembrane metalloprotease [Deltaproteobacteria bacterium]
MGFALLYVVTCVVWTVVVVVPLLLLLFGEDGLASPLALAVSAVGMSGGAFAIAEVARRLQTWSPGETWGLIRGSWGAPLWLGAALGAVFLGVVGEALGTGVWDLVSSTFGWRLPLDNLAAIAESLRTGPMVERAVFAAVVVLVGPLFEELVFRGFLWRVMDGDAHPVGAIITTSLIFALWHFDPIQSVGVLPLAVFLGVLRWRSGSLIPCVAVHVLNNGLAATTILAGWDEPATAPWLLVSLAAGAGAFALIGARRGIR